MLVDRLWPRGVTREQAHLDEWLKIIAPSPDLRKWYGHREEHWLEFQARYRDELLEEQQATEIDRLAEIAASGTLTLIYAARSETENHAVVLSDVLRDRLSDSDSC